MDADELRTCMYLFVLTERELLGCCPTPVYQSSLSPAGWSAQSDNHQVHTECPQVEVEKRWKRANIDKNSGRSSKTSMILYNVDISSTSSFLSLLLPNI